MSSYAQRAREVREKVLTLLEDIPQTRDDDKLLMATYWNRFDGINFNEAFLPNFVNQATSPESISRARRDIQAKGLFPPITQEARTRRRVRAEEARQHHAVE